MHVYINLRLNLYKKSLKTLCCCSLEKVWSSVRDRSGAERLSTDGCRIHQHLGVSPRQQTLISSTLAFDTPKRKNVFLLFYISRLWWLPTYYSIPLFDGRRQGRSFFAFVSIRFAKKWKWNLNCPFRARSGCWRRSMRKKPISFGLTIYSRADGLVFFSLKPRVRSVFRKRLNDPIDLAFARKKETK